MVDAIKAFGNVGVEDIFVLLADCRVDSLDRVPARPTRTEAITVRLEPGFPFGFQGELDQGLKCPVMDGRDSQWAEFVCPRLGDVDPPHGSRLSVQPERFGQRQALFRGDELDPIDPGGLLAPVVLGDPSHRDQLGCLTGQQQLLESAKSRKVTSLRGSVDPLLESEQVLLQGEPGQAVPAIISWHGLNSIGRLYHPDNRAHVSISSGFPRGLGFLGNPTSRGIRWTPAPRRRATERLLRSLPLFDVGRRDLLSAGLLFGCTVGKGRFPTRFTMPFWAKPITRVGLFPMTAVQQVRVPSRIRLS